MSQTSLVDQMVKRLVCLQCGRPGFNPWMGKILWRRQWQPTPVLLSGKSNGRRSLVGYSPWGHKESDTTQRLDFTSLVRDVLNEELVIVKVRNVCNAYREIHFKQQ